MKPITVSRDSRFYRPFMWLAKALRISWGIEAKDLNVCKLVWGMLFLPAGFVYRFGGEAALIFWNMAIVYLIIAWLPTTFGRTFWLAIGGLFLVLTVVAGFMHRRHEKQMQLTPFERRTRREEAAARAEARLERWEDQAERVRTWFQEHLFVTTLVTLPYVVSVRLVQLIGILAAPLTMPVAVPAIEHFPTGEERRLKRRLKKRQAEARQPYKQPEPGPLSQTLHSFHDRTCRTFQITE